MFQVQQSREGQKLQSKLLVETPKEGENSQFGVIPVQGGRDRHSWCGASLHQALLHQPKDAQAGCRRP